MGLGYIRNLSGQIINPATHEAQIDGSQQSQLIVQDQNGVLTVMTSRDGRIDGDQYFDDIARGVILGASILGAYGYYDAPGAVSDNVVQPTLVGGTVNVAPAGGVQMSVLSTSNEDGPGGTGVRELHIHYIDGQGYDADEDILIDGTTPVLTQATDIRFVQCMHMVSYGSAKQAVGNITLEYSGEVYSAIVAGSNRCSSSARMVPANHRLLIKNISAGSVSGTSARCEVKLGCTVFEGHNYTDDRVLIPVDEWLLRDASVTPLLDMPYSFPAGSVVALMATTDRAAIVSGSFRGAVELI